MSVPVRELKGVGESLSKKLSLLGIEYVRDLINYYPRKYIDFSVISSISSLKPGMVTVEVEIKQVAGRYVRRGMHLTEAVASDSTGSVRIIWFNQPYRAAVLTKTERYLVSGSFEMSRGKLAIMNPAIELAKSFPVNTARIVPIYKEVKGLRSATMRKIIASMHSNILKLPETLPSRIVEEYKLLSRAEASAAIHLPNTIDQLDAAKRRLGFEEVLSLALASLMNKHDFVNDSSHTINFNENLARNFVAALPFELTASQKMAAWEIFRDMEADEPMNRLLEGDVGSGKTVVAAMAAVMAINNGFQVAVMAPTEVLARQHATSFRRLLDMIGMTDEVALLVGSLKAKSKKNINSEVRLGSKKLLIGTHALINEDVSLKNLGLVIIDEQHRFGVEQRKLLQQKTKGKMPHVLSMTATPIPRTLALTLYGELDISVLKEKPSNRQPVITKIIPPGSRLKLYKGLDSELKKGHQIFVIAPNIADSDVMPSRSAEEIYQSLSREIYPNCTVGLLHGKLPPGEKEKVMLSFVDGGIDVLVSTTVVEVGVDVPNATVIVIEGPERFGLAQMHQLRGRVGRSNVQGYCYLVMSDSKEPTRRIRALASSADGFRLSELDLEIRGPGAIYGKLQSGQLDLRIAKLTDIDLIRSARLAAQRIIDEGIDLSEYPDLAEQVYKNRAITNLN